MHTLHTLLTLHTLHYITLHYITYIHKYIHKYILTQGELSDTFSFFLLANTKDNFFHQHYWPGKITATLLSFGKRLVFW